MKVEKDFKEKVGKKAVKRVAAIAAKKIKEDLEEKTYEGKDSRKKVFLQCHLPTGAKRIASH